MMIQGKNYFSAMVCMRMDLKQWRFPRPYTADYRSLVVNPSPSSDLLFRKLQFALSFLEAKKKKDTDAKTNIKRNNLLFYFIDGRC